jgi:hypothetical protein
MPSHRDASSSSADDAPRGGGGARRSNHRRSRSSPPPDSDADDASPSPSPSSHPHHPVNSISSRASDMGRRLAQERSTNRQLTQRISELEGELLLLRRGMTRKTHDDPSAAAAPFSSPPATTPARADDVDSADRAREIEGAALRSSETRRRAAADEEGAETNLSPRMESSADPIVDGRLPKTTDAAVDALLSSDRSSIEGVLSRAAKLLAEGSEDHRRNGGTIDGSESGARLSTDRDRGINGSTRSVALRERMHEYRELVTAFYSEQQSHGDIDGEEYISREDVLWLLNELKWRYEDILDGYERERSGEEYEDSHRIRELRECVESLANIVREGIEHPAHQNDRGRRGDPTIAEETHILHDEISSLKQRLTSFAQQVKEIRSSHLDDTEAMKRDFNEQLENKSQIVQHLESKISEQEEYIARIQNETRQAQQLMQEEKHKLALSREGTAARIRYLEGMLRSLQMELRGKGRVNRELQGVASTPPPVFLRDLTSAMGDADPWDETETRKGVEPSPPPIILRDLTSPMRDANPWDAPPPIFACDPIPAIKQLEPRQEDPMHDEHEADVTDDLDYLRGDAQHSPNGTGIVALRKQIASLGNLLADSETRRADMLDDFQRERQEYITQYKRLSDVLKKIIEERENAMLLGEGDFSQVKK